jgi:hypothetical protein
VSPPRWLRRTAVFVGASALATVGWVYLPAGADAPNSLQVFSASGTATSIGVVSRVPAETDGGVAFSNTTLDLTKARATAAAFTLGQLGEAFLITTLPGYFNATLAEAEYPATSAFKSDVTAVGDTNAPAGLPLTGQGAHFHAVTTAQPSATAEAVPATASIKGVISIGAGTSSAHSEVTADGSVITEVHASVASISIGGLLSIDGITSSAKVVVPLTGTPQTSLSVGIAGATLAGIPVEFTSKGLQINHQVALPPTALAAFNTALVSLAAQGLTIAAVPTAQSAGPGTATVSGAAFELHYHVPTVVALPTDIGKDEDIQIAEVSANALGRPRHPLVLPSPGAPDASFTSGGTTSGLGTAPLSASFPSGGATPATPGGAPTAATPGGAITQQAASPFTLPVRRRGLTAEQRLRTGYEVFILVAFGGAIVMATRSRTRLT